MSSPAGSIEPAASGMNDVLNAQGYTQAAWWNRIPIAVWMLMFLIAALSNLLLGFGMHGKASVLHFHFLIADIDSPRAGVIRIHPQNLYSVTESLKGQ
jgi:hypothetical protein